MAKKKPREHHENHERWIVSYADFVTLLLAFFIAMYAISKVNVAKLKMAEYSLAHVFHGATVVQHHSAAGVSPMPFKHMPAPIALPRQAPRQMKLDIPVGMERAIAGRLIRLQEIYTKLRALLHDMIMKGEVTVTRRPLGVVIQINASVLFASGQAVLEPEALTIVDRVAKVLGNVPYQIQVQGYTDDRPIHTAKFPSNWELSAVRAIAVVRRLVAKGVSPEHLVGAGYSKYRPIATNSTPQGRAKNRRVVIVVVAPRVGGKGSVPLVDAAGTGGPEDVARTK